MLACLLLGLPVDVRWDRRSYVSAVEVISMEGTVDWWYCRVANIHDNTST